MTTPLPVLQVRDLQTQFATERGLVRSVDGVSFDVMAGRTLAVVGESGSGKSVTSLSIMGLLDQATGKVAGGSIVFHDRDGVVHDLRATSPAAFRRLRGNDIAMIFQEPMTSLNPVFTVGEQIAEAVALHQRRSASEAWAAAVEMLRVVGIPAPERRARGDGGDGAVLSAEPVDRRRANDGARRHDPGADPGADAPDAARARHGDFVRDA